MVALSGLVVNCPGLVVHTQQKNKFQICSKIQFGERIVIRSTTYQKIRGGIRNFAARRGEGQRVRSSSVGRDYQPLRYDDDGLEEEPFWLSLVKEIVWGLKCLFTFLAAQPGQLKYLEWPSFQSTLKTASLTLVLVALLIVALSSVDSVLCFLLALFMRRSS